MEKTKRYYWIKLKTDFFNLAEIDFLLSQKDGCQYIVLYQMLCLQTANNNGELASRVGEMIIPYDPDKIARDTRYFSKDTVIVAMELFKKLNLIYTDDGICLKIAGFENMVGSETGWAKQKREKQKLLSGQCPPNSPSEIDIDKKLDILEFALKRNLLTKEQIMELVSTYSRCITDKNNLTKEQLKRMQYIVSWVEQINKFHRKIYLRKDLSREEKKKMHDTVYEIMGISIRSEIYNSKEKAKHELESYKMENDQCSYILTTIPSLIRKKVIK